ncbi:MAG TPA: hypothetical protein VGN20_11650 [Mucilaginibacter sp.]|jgi:hypothetical protein
MKLEITKACADSLRAFTQNNYGITLKSSHAHELVSAYLGYSSRATLLADTKFSIDNLADAEIIILSPPTRLVDQRLKTLENLPSGLPTSDILAEGVYAPIVADEQFFRKIWPGFREVAIALAEERGYEKLRMMGMNPKELDWITDVIIKTTESVVLMTVTFDYPANTKKSQRYSKVEITLSRIASGIGYTALEVKPTFYHGNMTDPDFRVKHGID